METDQNTDTLHLRFSNPDQTQLPSEEKERQIAAKLMRRAQARERLKKRRQGEEQLCGK